MWPPINKQKEDIEIRRKYASISAKRTTKGRDSAFSSRPSSRQSKSMTPVTKSQHFIRPPSASLSISPKLKKKIGKKYIGAAVMPTPAPAEAPAPAAVPAPVVPVAVVATPTVITNFLARSEKEKHVTFLLPHMVPEEVFLNLQMLKEEDKKALQEEIQTLKTTLENEKKKVERIRKEADQINKNWERKFLILRNSFHVLKDEMFTRHTLFRQFAVIGDTSFNYVKVKPLYVHSSMNLTESSSPTNAFQSTMVDHKFVDIPSDQVTFTQLPKVKSFTSQEKHLEKTSRPQHIPGRRAELHN